MAYYPQNAVEGFKDSSKRPVEDADPETRCNKADANPKDASNPKIKDDSKEAGDVTWNVHAKIQIELWDRITRQ